MAASPKTLALRVPEDIWNQKAPALLEALYAARCVIHAPDEHFHWLAGATQLYTAYTTAFPDTHFAIEDIVPDGDTVVVRYTFAGTHTGPLRGMAATGKRATVAGMSFRFADGNAIE